MSEKIKFIKANFEGHARNWAYALAYNNRWTEKQMDVVYEAIMNFIDQAVVMKKVEVKECPRWDEVERAFSEAIENEGIRRSLDDGYATGSGS